MLARTISMNKQPYRTGAGLGKRTTGRDMPLVRKPLSAWLLSVLILFGQTAALAHQFEHDVLEPHEYCSQCLTQSIFDGKAVAAVQTYTLILADAAPQVAVEGRYHSHYTLTSRARSPPIPPA